MKGNNESGEEKIQKFWGLANVAKTIFESWGLKQIRGWQYNFPWIICLISIVRPSTNFGSEIFFYFFLCKQKNCRRMSSVLNFNKIMLIIITLYYDHVTINDFFRKKMLIRWPKGTKNIFNMHACMSFHLDIMIL